MVYGISQPKMVTQTKNLVAVAEAKVMTQDAIEVKYY